MCDPTLTRCDLCLIVHSGHVFERKHTVRRKAHCFWCVGIVCVGMHCGRDVRFYMCIWSPINLLRHNMRFTWLALTYVPFCYRYQSTSLKRCAHVLVARLCTQAVEQRDREREREVYAWRPCIVLAVEHLEYDIIDNADLHRSLSWPLPTYIQQGQRPAKAVHLTYEQLLAPSKPHTASRHKHCLRPKTLPACIYTASRSNGPLMQNDIIFLRGY